MKRSRTKDDNNLICFCDNIFVNRKIRCDYILYSNDYKLCYTCLIYVLQQKHVKLYKARFVLNRQLENSLY